MVGTIDQRGLQEHDREAGQDALGDGFAQTLLNSREEILRNRAADDALFNDQLLGIARLELDEAKEKIELQVNQATFKIDEAGKRTGMTEKNLAKADENLRNAQIGFEEGVLTTDNVLEAQTAWLKARSEYIDAQIELRLCKVYLAKALGEMKY